MNVVLEDVPALAKQLVRPGGHVEFAHHHMPLVPKGMRRIDLALAEARRTYTSLCLGGTDG